MSSALATTRASSWSAPFTSEETIAVRDALRCIARHRARRIVGARSLRMSRFAIFLAKIRGSRTRRRSPRWARFARLLHARCSRGGTRDPVAQPVPRQFTRCPRPAIPKARFTRHAGEAANSANVVNAADLRMLTPDVVFCARSVTERSCISMDHGAEQLLSRGIQIRHERRVRHRCAELGCELRASSRGAILRTKDADRDVRPRSEASRAHEACRAERATDEANARIRDALHRALVHAQVTRGKQ